MIELFISVYVLISSMECKFFRMEFSYSLPVECMLFHTLSIIRKLVSFLFSIKKEQLFQSLSKTQKLVSFLFSVEKNS